TASLPRRNAPSSAPLDVETRQQRRRASRQRYEAKNLERRREAAKLRMHSTRAAIAEADYTTRRKNYRDQLDAAERERRRIADAESRRVRKQEAESLRKKHAAGTPRKSVKNLAFKTPHKAAKKLRGISSDEEEDSEEEQDGGTQRPLPQLSFEARAPHPARLRCKACGLDDCLGCACMCEVSIHWFDHPDGHFFLDCKSCGGTRLPW
ncbi:hypothetical protein B0H14DRAFT_2736457, partial [Mycena olivaceomarginata]